MRVVGFDHLVLTVASIDATVAFYEALGFEREVFGPQQRVALRFGPHKINLHQVDRTFEPKAVRPTAGSGDLCFLVDHFEGIAATLDKAGIAVLEGPVGRTGARGPIRSYYVRDPDGNLVELSAYVDGSRPAA